MRSHCCCNLSMLCAQNRHWQSKCIIRELFKHHCFNQWYCPSKTILSKTRNYYYFFTFSFSCSFACHRCFPFLSWHSEWLWGTSLTSGHVSIAIIHWLTCYGWEPWSPWPLMACCSPSNHTDGPVPSRLDHLTHTYVVQHLRAATLHLIPEPHWWE